MRQTPPRKAQPVAKTGQTKQDREMPALIPCEQQPWSLSRTARFSGPMLTSA